MSLALDALDSVDLKAIEQDLTVTTVVSVQRLAVLLVSDKSFDFVDELERNHHLQHRERKAMKKKIIRNELFFFGSSVLHKKCSTNEK